MVIHKETLALFKRNRAAFKKYHPQVWRILENLAPSSSVGAFLPNADVTKAQVSTYFKNPSRIGFESSEHCNMSPVSLGLYKDITAYLRDSGFKEWTNLPEVDVGYAFVFGIGLGFHIQDLVARNICSHLVLIEPSADYIVKSMLTVDWERVFGILEEQQNTVHFLVSQDASMVADAVDEIILHFGSTFLEGSYYYSHYKSPELLAAETLLRERIQNHYVSSGFFEDEILMVRNTFGSLKSWGFHLVDEKPLEKQDIPAFIVGSGPSLDNDLQIIKKWREHVILFSCGSSLGVLLKNGIRPDFHVENENIKESVEILEDCHNKYGLQGIRLLASTTIDPDVGKHFDKLWFFFRPALSSTSIMRGGANPIIGADPLVSNSAYAISTVIGFENVYMFGLDCGRPIGGRHHAKDALYYDEGNELEADEVDGCLSWEVPGNFGGKVVTSHFLDLSRLGFATCYKQRPVNLINCSDGARIDGAKPMYSKDIDLSNPSGRQQEVLERVEQQLSFFEPGEYLKSVDFASYVDACDKFKVAFGKLINEAQKKDRGFYELEQRLEKFWIDHMAELKGVLMVIGGSYASMVRLGAFLGNRMEDETARLAFFRFFLKKYQDTCFFMAQETKKLFQEIDGITKEFQNRRN